jgi:hypothetical protein
MNVQFYSICIRSSTPVIVSILQFVSSGSQFGLCILNFIHKQHIWQKELSIDLHLSKVRKSYFLNESSYDLQSKHPIACQVIIDYAVHGGKFCSQKENKKY